MGSDHDPILLQHIERFSLDLETKTGQTKVSVVLIGPPNTRPTRVPSDLTLCFDFELSGKQDSVHRLHS